MIRAEQLYHRYRAGQVNDVLSLADQRTFREQYRRLRSPALIREDAALALGVAAGRADVGIMLGLLLALVEMGERTASLESVNMPGLLHDCGADRRGDRLLWRRDSSRSARAHL